MSRAVIQFHIRTIECLIAEMTEAEAAEDQMTAGMICDAIAYRKSILAKHGVVIV